MPPPRQRTFELIPTSLSKGVAKPPMTSKAAKKAYLQANRGPKVSRAEQRRLDAEELARQKKEYEKERAAARAKAAREKKAERAKAEREARKKLGLPEPQKGVRASQPTISIFARSGNKRTWQVMDDMEEESEDTVCGETVQQSPPKQVTAETESEDEFGDFPSLSQTDILQRIDSSFLSTNGDTVALMPPAKQTGVVSDPYFLKFSSLSQSDLLEKDSIIPAAPDTKTAASKSSSCSPNNAELLSPGQNSRKPPNLRSNGVDDDFPFSSTFVFANLAATQLLSGSAEVGMKSGGAEKASSISKPATKPSPNSIKQKERQLTVKSQEFRKLSRLASPFQPVLQEFSVNISPPPLLNKGRKTITFAPSPNKRRPVSRTPTPKFSRALPNISLLTTQAFLENHMDDFFPSSSQEIRELLDDLNDFPSNTQIAKELSPCKPVLNNFQDLFSTQDFAMSSQELLEITTPSRVSNCIVDRDPQARTPGCAKVPAKKPKLQPFLLSRSFNRSEPVARHITTLHQAREKGRSPLTQSSPSKHANSLEAAPPKVKKRFFDEKEDDLIQAALHESKVQAAAEEKARKGEEVTTSTKSKRTLQRAQSNVTDYGDDEFSGCSQELLALLTT